MSFIRSFLANSLRSFVSRRDLLGVVNTLESFNMSNHLYNRHFPLHCNSYGSSFLQHKKSDTLFILGSGPSISLLNDSDWNIISNCDSVGFNRWFYHPFAPDFYFFSGDGAANNVGPTMGRYINQKVLSDFYSITNRIDYSNCRFLFRGPELRDNWFTPSDSYFSNIPKINKFIFKELAISSKLVIDTSQLVTCLRGLEFLEFNSPSTVIPKLYFTITLIMFFAIQMGYKNVILLGCDMNAPVHFWNTPKYCYLAKQYNLSASSEIWSKSIFKASNKSNVTNIVGHINDWSLKHNFSSFHIFPSSSALCSVLPIYKFHESS